MKKYRCLLFFALAALCTAIVVLNKVGYLSTEKAMCGFYLVFFGGLFLIQSLFKEPKQVKVTRADAFLQEQADKQSNEFYKGLEIGYDVEGAKA